MTRRFLLTTTVALSLWAVFQSLVVSPLTPSQSNNGQPRAHVVYAQDDAGTVVSSVLTATEALTETLTAIPTATLSVDVRDTFTISEAVSYTIDLIDEVVPSADISQTITLSETSESIENPATPASTEPDVDTPLGVVDGTILANRTTATVKFFVEGETLELPSLRSIGLDLPRANAVLNLYNCDAAIAETDERCFWDPYMIDRDKFYEIVAGVDVGRAVGLLLQEVGGPEGDAIWIQNRSGAPEVVVYRNEVYDIQPGAIREFGVGDDALPTFFLRSCVNAEGESACEWAPAIVEAGDYYTLELLETAGSLPNSMISVLQLASTSATASNVSEDVAETPIAVKQIQCNLLVPALNVRSGPGLEYQIVAKIRGTETEAATVLIVGRSATGDWLAVDERVAPGGWITGSANFVACESAPSELDEVAVTDGRLAPTPEPVAEVDVPAAEVVQEEEVVAEAEEAVPTPIAEIPKGQGLMVINNGFEHDIRFTLDQKYRVDPGPSEYDLKSGDSVSIFVYPGMVGFSASTPWRTLSGNDDFFIEEEETRTLWLYFVPDPDGSGEWLLVH